MPQPPAPSSVEPLLPVKSAAAGGMSSPNRLALSGVVDDLSACTTAEGSLLIAAATSNFIGRWWTGSIAVAAQDPVSGDMQLLAESSLRAGVAGVAWLPASDGQQPAVLVSGSDDGSVDAWRYQAGEAQLQHQHGSVAHDDLVGLAAACAALSLL